MQGQCDNVHAYVKVLCQRLPSTDLPVCRQLEQQAAGTRSIFTITGLLQGLLKGLLPDSTVRYTM